MAADFLAYQQFLAIRSHFTTDSYDYFFYNGSIKANEKSFNQNKHKQIFGHLARSVPSTELRDFLASNFAYSKKKSVWLTDFAEKDAKENYKKFLRYKEASSYYFEQDLTIIGDVREAITVPKNSTYPILLSLLIQNKIHLETGIILQRFIGFIPLWTQHIQEPYVWPKWKTKIEKFTPFVVYDEKKCAKILKKACTKYCL